MNVENKLKLIKLVLTIAGALATLLILAISYIKYTSFELEGNDLLFHIIIPMCVIPVILIFLIVGYFIIKKYLLLEAHKKAK